MVNSSKSLDLSLVLLAVCLFGLHGKAMAAVHTSTYVFVAEQSKVVRTGGIASAPLTYTIKGEFQLAVDPNLGTASFAHVDANATDDSPFKHTLDLNHVFNMTSLVGTIVDDATLKFTGKAPDDSDVGITVILQNGLAHLIGQTTPPPQSADFFIFSLDAVAQRKYGGGSGTAEDPYQIATAADLIALGGTPGDYGKHFILTNDIDLDPNLLGGKVFDKAVIAPDTDPTDPRGEFQGPLFTGVFDGNGHTISHLTIKGGAYLGLFGRLHSVAEVRDLGVADVNIIGSGGYVGGLVGYKYGAVTRCYSTGTIGGGAIVGGLVGENLGSVGNCYSTAAVSGGWRVGGLVGENWGTVSGCYSTGAVSGIGSDVGGLVGCNWYGAVSQCYSIGAVSGTERVGGLVGENAGPLAHCYSTGTVSGTNYGVGGLVGCNDAGANIWYCYSTSAVSGARECVGGLVGSNGLGTICHCYSTGAVKGVEKVGGLVGSGDGNDVVASFWDTQSSGQDASAGGTGKTTAEMQTPGTFLDVGWDFVNIWGIGENQTYPYLRKYSAADINQDASVNFLDLAALAENWLEGLD